MATDYKNYKGDLITNCPKPEGTCWQPLHLTKEQRKQQMDALKRGESLTFIDNIEKDPFTTLGDYTDWFNEDLIGGKYSRADLMEQGLTAQEIENLVAAPKKDVPKATWSSAMLLDIEKKGIVEVNKFMDSETIMAGLYEQLNNNFQSIPEEDSTERNIALSEFNAKPYYYMAVTINMNKDKYEPRTQEMAKHVLGQSHYSIDGKIRYTNPLTYQNGKSYFHESVSWLENVARTHNKNLKEDVASFDRKTNMYKNIASTYNRVADGDHFEKPNDELVKARVRKAILQKQLNQAEEKEYNGLRGRLGLKDSKNLVSLKLQLQSAENQLRYLEK
jgi:hypothetical protein